MAASVDAPYTRVRLPSGKRLIFDAQCEAPHGWEALEAVFRSRPGRK
jgi:ribosomal protein L2